MGDFFKGRVLHDAEGGLGIHDHHSRAVTVLVDDALSFEEVDVAAARAQLAEATERQKAVSEPHQFAREQAIIDLANAKLHVAGVQ